MNKETLERLDDDDWNILKQKIFQLSAETLLKLGKCGGSKCMYCPYEPKHTQGNENIHNNCKSQNIIR